MHTDLILEAALALQPRWRALLGDEGSLQAQSLLRLAEEDATQRDAVANLLLDLFAQRGAREDLLDEMPLSGGPTIGGARLLFETLPGDPGPVAALGTRYRCPERGCTVTWTPQLAGQRVPYCTRHPHRRLEDVDAEP